MKNALSSSLLPRNLSHPIIRWSHVLAGKHLPGVGSTAAPAPVNGSSPPRLSQPNKWCHVLVGKRLPGVGSTAALHLSTGLAPPGSHNPTNGVMSSPPPNGNIFSKMDTYFSFLSSLSRELMNSASGKFSKERIFKNFINVKRSYVQHCLCC
jgi:hypothetical protein